MNRMNSLCVQTCCSSCLLQLFHRVDAMRLMACVQRSLLDVVALGLGAACSVQPAREGLQARRGPQALCRRKHLIMLTAATLLAAAMTGTMCWYLTTQPWYVGSNHADKQVLCKVNCHVSLQQGVDLLPLRGGEYTSIF